MFSCSGPVCRLISTCSSPTWSSMKSLVQVSDFRLYCMSLCCLSSEQKTGFSPQSNITSVSHSGSFGKVYRGKCRSKVVAIKRYFGTGRTFSPLHSPVDCNEGIKYSSQSAQSWFKNFKNVDNLLCFTSAERVCVRKKYAIQLKK